MNGAKTYLGLLIAALPTVANLLGYDVSANFSAEAEEVLTDLITLVGLAFAFYARSVATVPGWFSRR